MRHTQKTVKTWPAQKLVAGTDPDPGFWSPKDGMTQNMTSWRSRITPAWNVPKGQRNPLIVKGLLGGEKYRLQQ